MFYTPNFEMQPGETPGVRQHDRAALRLWAAVFRQGLQDWAAETFDLHPRANMPDNYRRGASLRWFESDANTPGSFVWLCDLFEIHPDQARSMARSKRRELVRDVGQRF